MGYTRCVTTQITAAEEIMMVKVVITLLKFSVKHFIVCCLLIVPSQSIIKRKGDNLSDESIISLFATGQMNSDKLFLFK